MKNCITILLLINFLVFQYARQFSYWECRLTNYFKVENDKCDCEKLTRTFTGQSPSPQLPITHHHFHADESFYPSRVEETASLYICLANEHWGGNFFISKRMPDRVDRPPQVSSHIFYL